MVIQIPFKDFSNLATKIKAMKSEIICSFYDKIYGADQNFYIIKRIHVPDMVLPIQLVAIAADITEFVKNSKEMGCETIYIDTETSDIYSDYGYLPCNIDKAFVTANFCRCIMSLEDYTNRNPVISIDNLKENEDFANVLAQKTADGIGIVRIGDCYAMTLYNNLLPVVKADKVELNIFDLSNRDFLSWFTIKKAKYTMDVLIKYTKIN